MILEFLHNLTHCHIAARKEGMGEFIFCRWRIARSGNIWYRPDFSGATWHKVPDPDDNEFDNSKAVRMFKSGSSEQAMAILREESA